MKQYEMRGIQITCRSCGATKIINSIPPGTDPGRILGCGHKNYLARGVKAIPRRPSEPRPTASGHS